MGAVVTESTQELAAHLRGIFVARHGETDYNAGQRFQGQLPVALNAKGRAQAAELAELAAGHDFCVLWCSPLARARETAEIVGARIGLVPIEDVRLAETDAGDWTDRPWSEIEKEDPEKFAAFMSAAPEFAFPGGESYAEQSARMLAALREIAAGPKPALVVCHALSIRLALTRLGRERDRVANGALIEL